MIKNGATHKEAIDALAPRSRDNARTPYQWNREKNAGFTTGKPWMKLNPRYEEINLEADLKSDDSIFRYYSKLFAMRREHLSAICDGDLTFYLEDHPSLIVYTRESCDEKILVIANYTDKTTESEIPISDEGKKTRLITNYRDTLPSLDKRRAYLPYECEVYLIKK